MKFKSHFRLLAAILFIMLFSWISPAQPIRQDITNPHYLNYKGKPIILLTSDHAYGALVFKNFDYEKFLETLASNGMNFTRVYPGAVPPAWFAWPADIYPWVKTASGKYDLDKWNPEFFKRLKGFVEYARERDIIVDICFFNGTGNFSNAVHPHHPDHVYEEFPLYPSNNIQRIGETDCKKFNILGNSELNKKQIEYVKKITSFLRNYDNVLFDVADEPDAKVDPADFTPWLDKMLEACVNEDKNKHLVSVCNAGANCKQYNFVGDKRTTWVSMEYLEGLKKLSTDYKFNKPLVLIESCTFCSDTTDQRLQYIGDAISDSRVEAWEYLVGGAAGFMQFNFDYSRPFFNPGLTGAKSSELFVQKRILKDFINSFEFVKMSPDSFGTKPSGAFSSGISERGKQYAFYMHHSTKEHRYFWGSYMVVPGEYKNEPVSLFNMPSGTYKVEWINPKDGKAVSSPYIIVHGGGTLILYTPTYHIDIALRIKNVESYQTTLLYGSTNKPSTSTFILDEKVSLNFNWLKLNHSDTLDIEISNEKNQLIWSTSQLITEGSDSLLLKAPSNKFGYYRVGAKLRNDGTSLPAIGTRGAGYFTYCVVPDPATRPIYADTLSRFGMQGATHSTIPYLGVRWILSDGYGWKLEEPDSAGQFLSKRKAAIKKHEQYPTVKPVMFEGKAWPVYTLPTFGGWMNSWAVIPETHSYCTGALNPNNEKDWVNYCKAATEAFKENYPDRTRRVYQITWEPVLSWGYKGTAAQLAHIYELCYQTIHDVDPLAEVVGPTLGESTGITNNILQQTQNFLYAGGRKYIDGISMHPYCQIPTWEPELKNGLRNLMGNVVNPALGRITRFYGTEHGNKILTKGDFLDELNQARMLILENVTMLGEGAQFNLSFYGYDWLTANEGHPENEEGYMGYYYNLSNEPWRPSVISPKPAVAAYAASSYLLEGHLSQGSIPNLKGQTTGYKFSKIDGADVVFVLWNTFENQTITLNVGNVPSVDVIDWMGNQVSKEVSNGSISIEAGKDPTYIKPSSDKL